MIRMLCRLLVASVAVSVVIDGAAALAQETTKYSYDTLGRLTGSVISGGPNGGKNMATCFDAAGNRTRFNMALSGVATCSGGSPPPPPGNQPPVAVSDTISIPCNTSAVANLTANDSDPDNNVPLTLVSVTPNVTTSTVVTKISASNVSIAAAGKQQGLSFSYVVADSLGATSTGTLSLVITGTALACGGGGGTQ